MNGWVVGAIMGYIPGAIAMFRLSIIREMSRVHKRIVECILCTDGCVCTRCKNPKAWDDTSWPISHHTQGDHRAVLHGDSIALAVLIALLWPLVAVSHLVIDGGKVAGKGFWRLLFPHGVRTRYSDQLSLTAKEREYADMIERSVKLDADIRRLSEEIGLESTPTTKDHE